MEELSIWSSVPDNHDLLESWVRKTMYWSKVRKKLISKKGDTTDCSVEKTVYSIKDGGLIVYLYGTKSLDSSHTTNNYRLKKIVKSETIKTLIIWDNIFMTLG